MHVMSTPIAVAAPAASTTRLTVSLLGVMLAMLLSMLDNTMVGTAMSTIVRELGGFDLLSWVVGDLRAGRACSWPRS